MRPLQPTSFGYQTAPYTNPPIKQLPLAGGTNVRSYYVQTADNGTIIVLTPSAIVGTNVYLPLSTTVGSGFSLWVINSSTSVQFILNTASGETLDTGLASQSLYPGGGVQLFADPTLPGWRTIGQRTLHTYAENYPSGGNSYAAAAGGSAVAVGVGANAAASNSLALGSSANAQANNSAAIGLGSAGASAYTSSGSGSIAIGNSYASGADSFAAAITNNTSSYGAQGATAIAIGKQSQATAGNSVSVGSYGVASATYATVLSAYGTASRTYAATLFGARAWGNAYAKGAYGPASLISQGTVQGALQVLYANTTGSTATVMTADGGIAGGVNAVYVQATSALAFTGTVVARQQSAGGTASAAWTISGLIRQESIPSTTTLVASTVTAISNVPGWTLALSADTTYGALAITATGAAATNILWVANIQITEGVYA